MTDTLPSKGLLEGLRHNERSIANEPWLQDMCGNAADEIERLEAELEQANDIRSDREILIELMRGALGVSIEPHQTLSERLVEAAGRSNVDWCCPHYKPRGEGCTECRTPEPPADDAVKLAMRAGSWFDRKDLTLHEREMHVAQLFVEFAKARATQPPSVDPLPIATAPRDGTSFIGVMGQWLTMVSWNKHRNAWCSVCNHYCPLPDGEVLTGWLPRPVLTK